MTDFAWTDERIEMLKDLWAKGASGSEIAEAFGGGPTRNAVLGKVHKLRLAGRKTVTLKPRDKKTRIAVMPGFESVRPEGLPKPRASDFDIPVEQRCSLQDLTSKTCRWPVGDPATPEFFFCGALADNDVHPYCEVHRNVARPLPTRGTRIPNRFVTF